MLPASVLHSMGAGKPLIDGGGGAVWVTIFGSLLLYFVPGALLLIWAKRPGKSNRSSAGPSLS
jgi:hypothetical protein